MKDFTAIISSCKFGSIKISEANRLINEQLDAGKDSGKEIQQSSQTKIPNESEIRSWLIGHGYNENDVMKMTLHNLSHTIHTYLSSLKQ